MLYTEDSIGVFILVFFQLLDMCESISKHFLKEKGWNLGLLEGQSELLSPGGAGAFQIKLTKQVNSLCWQWNIYLGKIWVCREGNTDYKSSFLIVSMFTCLHYYVLCNLKSFSEKFSLSHSWSLLIFLSLPRPFIHFSQGYSSNPLHQMPLWPTLLTQ